MSYTLAFFASESSSSSASGSRARFSPTITFSEVAGSPSYSSSSSSSCRHLSATIILMLPYGAYLFAVPTKQKCGQTASTLSSALGRAFAPGDMQNLPDPHVRLPRLRLHLPRRPRTRLSPRLSLPVTGVSRSAVNAKSKRASRSYSSLSSPSSCSFSATPAGAAISSGSLDMVEWVQSLLRAIRT